MFRFKFHWVSYRLLNCCNDDPGAGALGEVPTPETRAMSEPKPYNIKECHFNAAIPYKKILLPLFAPACILPFFGLNYAKRTCMTPYFPVPVIICPPMQVKAMVVYDNQGWALCKIQVFYTVLH